MGFQHPHRSLAQVNAAPAYYGDHQEQFDRTITGELDEWEKQSLALKDSPIRRKLRTLGKLR